MAPRKTKAEQAAEKAAAEAAAAEQAAAEQAAAEAAAAEQAAKEQEQSEQEPAPVVPAEGEPNPPIESSEDEDQSEDEAEGEGPETPEGRIAAVGAPLEAPAPRKVETPSDAEASEGPQHSGGIGHVMVAHSPAGSRLIDNETGEAPDPDTLFVPAEGPGVFAVCTVRLLQNTYTGDHDEPLCQLVMAKGTETSQDKAASIVAILRAQIAADEAAAQAEPDAE